MSIIRRFLHTAAADLERDIDRIAAATRQGEGHYQKVRLLAYAGYRNDALLRLKGRIVPYEKPLDASDGTLARLQAMMEKLLEEVSFDVEERPGSSITVDAVYVEAQLAEIARNTDLCR